VILDPPKPRKRLVGRLLWPVIITILAIVAVVVSGAGSDTRADLEYLDEVHEQSVGLSVGGDSLRAVVSRLSRIDRTELVTVVDGIREDVAIALAMADEGPPSDSLVSVNALYRQALDAWDKGVGGLASGLLTAADDPSNGAVADIVANALAELRAGDQHYATMVGELGREDVPDPVAPMPEVEMLPTEGELFSLASIYVTAARSPNNELPLRPSLAVSQVIPQPDWTVNPEGQVVVPSTESIIFSIVITNTGNVVSLEETLRLSVAGDGEPSGEEVPVISLRPGQQTSVVFEPVPVEGGGVYEVTATLIVGGSDAAFDDNEISVVFSVNEG
jgi:hypothetical protein